MCLVDCYLPYMAPTRIEAVLCSGDYEPEPQVVINLQAALPQRVGRCMARTALILRKLRRIPRHLTWKCTKGEAALQRLHDAFRRTESC